MDVVLNLQGRQGGWRLWCALQAGYHCMTVQQMSRWICRVAVGSEAELRALSAAGRAMLQVLQ